MHKEQIIFVNQKISELMCEHCIEETKFDNSGWLSNIFLREKKDGGFRMILNLKFLNEKILDQKFKMEQIFDAQKMISKHSFMITIDISNAYHHLSIKPEYQKFLQFKWQNKCYKFVTLAQGIKFGPLVFTKLCKPILGHCRSCGIKIMMYIDDIFITADSKVECEKHKNYVLRLLQKCGFIINWNKSQLQPVQEITLLDFVINSKRLDMRLTNTRRKVMLNLIDK